jgi:AcrR family transcriptional regulator
MKDEKSKTSTRETLLRAAIRVVQQGSVASLTLDAVAREAGVSKGGLLYHFPSKDALIKGLVSQFIAEWNRAMDWEFERDPEPELPGRWLRAYIRSCFANYDAEEYSTLGLTQGDVAGFLVAISSDAELLEDVYKEYEIWDEKCLNDGIDPAVATVVRLAADGLYFSEAFHLAPPTGEAKRKVMESLLALARPSGQ